MNTWKCNWKNQKQNCMIHWAALQFLSKIGGSSPFCCVCLFLSFPFQFGFAFWQGEVARVGWGGEMPHVRSAKSQQKLKEKNMAKEQAIASSCWACCRSNWLPRGFVSQLRCCGKYWGIPIPKHVLSLLKGKLKIRWHSSRVFSHQWSLRVSFLLSCAFLNDKRKAPLPESRVLS